MTKDKFETIVQTVMDNTNHKDPFDAEMRATGKLIAESTHMSKLIGPILMMSME